VRKSRLMLSVLAVAAVAVGGCGGSDDSDKSSAQTTTTVVVAAKTIPALSGADKGDPAGAKVDDSGVYLCSSISVQGEIGNVAFDGFHDISVRGMSCDEGSDRIIDTYRSWDGTATAETVDGYACKVLYVDDAFATVRCTKGDDHAYRFTLQRESRPSKPKRTKEIVEACGAFGHFYDISVRDIACHDAQNLIAAAAGAITDLKQGSAITVAEYRCTVLYVQAGDQTVRCVDDQRSIRVSVTEKVAPKVPKKPPEQEKFVKVVNKKSGTTSSGLSNRVVAPCAAYQQWDAITARGASCALVYQALQAGGQPLTQLAKGASFPQSPFTCKRVDTLAGQAPTVSCTQPSGVSFRASLIGNAQGGAAGGDAAPSAPTTPTTPKAPTTPTTPAATTPADETSTTATTP
jgi:hypothetical protein